MLCRAWSSWPRQAGLGPNPSAPKLASAVDFVLEGLYSLKKIGRSDERGYQAAEQARRREPRTEPVSLDDGLPLPGRKKVLQLSWRSRRCVTATPGLPARISRRSISTSSSRRLSDLLLSSGFQNPYGDGEDDRTMDALREAILEALFSGGLLSEEMLNQLMGDPADGDQSSSRSTLDELIDEIIRRLEEQGFITTAPDLDAERRHRQGTGADTGEPSPPVKFEVTDKSLDFLGYRALRDLLGSARPQQLRPSRYARTVHRH